jgi:hypothetical protein
MKDKTNVEIMEYLSELTEQYGVRFEYTVERDTITSLVILQKPNAELNSAIDVMLMAIGILAECALEGLAHFNSDQRMGLRLQQLKTLRDTMGDTIQQKYVHSVDSARQQLEIVKSIN